jgi:hypothetical protein
LPDFAGGDELRCLFIMENLRDLPAPSFCGGEDRRLSIYRVLSHQPPAARIDQPGFTCRDRLVDLVDRRRPHARRQRFQAHGVFTEDCRTLAEMPRRRANRRPRLFRRGRGWLGSMPDRRTGSKSEAEAHPCGPLAPFGLLILLAQTGFSLPRFQIRGGSLGSGAVVAVEAGFHKRLVDLPPPLRKMLDRICRDTSDLEAIVGLLDPVSEAAKTPSQRTLIYSIRQPHFHRLLTPIEIHRA